METLDLVVIGAGIAGLAAAKTHRQLSPHASLAVLEANADAGGVWASDRLYPGLRTNNLLGTYEYPDFPMDPAVFDVQPGEHVPAAAMHAYLEAYARAFCVWEHIRFGTRVVAAEHRDDDAEGGWTLTLARVATHGPGGAEAVPVAETEAGAQPEIRLAARKLIVATGMTSSAYMPRFAGQDVFGAPLFHTRDLLAHADTLDAAKTRRVAVLGGGKSSWDAVYQYATRGVHVDWIMRESGGGPIWQAPPYVTPLRKWLEKLVNTRLLTWFSPCIWGAADGYGRVRSFLHGTALGRALVDGFWGVLTNDIVSLNGYDRHAATARLKPWTPAMFAGSSFSILNYPTDFFDLVRSGAVRVHVADVARLAERAVILPDGTTLPTDALCCGTGWTHAPPLRFLPAGLEREMGIPCPTVRVGDGDDDDDDNDLRAVWRPEAVARADVDILSRFPRLGHQPAVGVRLEPKPEPELTPYSLYRLMVPPSERLMAVRDVAFAGALMNFSVAPIAHAQALWIHAYFSGALSSAVIPPLLPTKTKTPMLRSDAGPLIKTMDQVRYEAVLFSRFGRWRYPAGHRGQIPDFVFDAVPYLDLLVGDLGLEVRRKRGWFAEATEPYGPEDYRHLMGEWLARQKTW